MTILYGDISDIILKKKNSYKACTTLEKVEWICTVSLRLVEWFSPYPQTLLNKLEGEPVVAKFATPKKYGRKEGYTQMQKIDYYNLDMIISVGYRVKSRNGMVWISAKFQNRNIGKFLQEKIARISTGERFV